MTDYSQPVSSSDDPDVVLKKIAYAAQHGGGGGSLTPTGVTPGPYTNTNLTVNEFGQLTLASSGPASSPTNIWVEASSMIPRVTAGAGVNSTETTTNDVNYDTLDFDPGTVEGAQFSVVMPNNWNAAEVELNIHWTNDSGSGNVVWGVGIRSIAAGGALDQAYGADDNVTSAASAGNLAIANLPLVSIAGTPANGQRVQFQIVRNAVSGSDTLATDARLLGVEIVMNV